MCPAGGEDGPPGSEDSRTTGQQRAGLLRTSDQIVLSLFNTTPAHFEIHYFCVLWRDVQLDVCAGRFWSGDWQTAGKLNWETSGQVRNDRHQHRDRRGLMGSVSLL